MAESTNEMFYGGEGYKNIQSFQQAKRLFTLQQTPKMLAQFDQRILSDQQSLDQ